MIDDTSKTRDPSLIQKRLPYYYLYKLLQETGRDQIRAKPRARTCKKNDRWERHKECCTDKFLQFALDEKQQAKGERTKRRPLFATFLLLAQSDLPNLFLLSIVIKSLYFCYGRRIK